MNEETNCYERHIYNTNDIHIKKLNMYEINTHRLYVLDDINELNYYPVINFILTSKFNSPDAQNVKFLINSKVILFKDLKFENLEDMVHGKIFYFSL